MKIKLKSSFLINYLISLLVLVLLPLFLIMQFVFGGYLNTLENELLNRNKTMLTQASSIVDMKMREIEQVAISISLNTNLLPYTATQNNYRAFKTCQEIQKYMVGNELIFEIVYYIRGNPLLYASGKSFPSDSFVTNYFRYSGMTQQEFMDYIETTDSSLLLPAQTVVTQDGVKSLLTYIVPISNGGAAYATAVFFIDESKIESIVNNVFKSSNGQNLIFTGSGKLLSGLGARDLDFEEIYKAVMQSYDKVMLYKDKKYLSTIKQAGYSDWTYISYCPFEDVMSPAIRIKNTISLLLIIVSLLSTLVVWISINFNYLPIMRIFKKIEGSKNENEILAIDKAIDALSVDNIHMREYIEENRDIIAQRFLQDLFKGNIPDLETFQAMMAKSGLNLSGCKYATLIFMIQNTENESKTSHDYIKLVHIIKPLLKDLGAEIYPLDVIGKETMPILLTLRDEYELASVASAFFNALADNGITATAGVSCVYDDPLEIALTYSQASSALAYRFIKGKNSLIYYGNIAVATKKIWYPKHEMEELVKHVSGRNVEGINKNVQSILAHIKQEDMDLFAARCLCYDLINTIIKFVSELSIRTEDIDKHLSNITKFSQIETVDELCSNLDSFCVELSKLVSMNNDSQTATILSYLRNHFTESDFSVKRMSDDLNISYSYMSKYFHAKTSYTLLDYVTILRLDKVKNMLASTDETIKDIILSAGYIDIPNFSRKFKQREGVTPGQYRENYRKSTKKS